MATSRHNILQAVCLGQCKSKDLPAQLDLRDISAEMNRLWRRSIQKIRHGVVTEFGATLVWEHGRLRLINIEQGTAGEINLKAQVYQEQKFVGTFHTHPYEEGWLGIAFSGEDFASAINTHENISVVHGGNRIAALVRTDKSSKAVSRYRIIDWANALLRHYLIELKSFDEAVLKMNTELCIIHKLAFYLGAPTGQLNLRYKP